MAASPGSFTASTLACGIAMPPPMPVLPSASLAVSYTHLDVYKRQTFTPGTSVILFRFPVCRRPGTRPKSRIRFLSMLFFLSAFYQELPQQIISRFHLNIYRAASGSVPDSSYRQPFCLTPWHACSDGWYWSPGSHLCIRDSSQTVQCRHAIRQHIQLISKQNQLFHTVL